LTTSFTHPEGQSKNLDPTDPVKQTADQVLLLKRPKQVYKAKSVQYLALNEPKVLTSLERLNSNFALKPFIDPQRAN